MSRCPTCGAGPDDVAEPCCPPDVGIVAAMAAARIRRKRWDTFGHIVFILLIVTVIITVIGLSVVYKPNRGAEERDCAAACYPDSPIVSPRSGCWCAGPGNLVERP